MPIGKLKCVFIILAVVAGAAKARAKVVEDTAGSLKTLASIGDALNSPDRHPVHVLYVHGIDAIGAGDSALLRESICSKLNLCAASDWKNAGAEFADQGEFAPGSQPPPLIYLGNPIWNNADEWRASAPFVVHWEVHLRHHAAVLVVDEVNWWPLVLALKCRHIVAAEANLAGPDESLLNVCSQSAAQDPGGLGRFYPWISPEEAAKLAKTPPHGALINRSLKDGLIDWGLSDVLLTTGPLGSIVRDGLRQLMAKSAAFDPNATGTASSASDAQGKYDWRAQLRGGATPGGTEPNATKIDQEFIAVTHSLGCYLLFNTLTQEPSDAGGRNRSDVAREADEDNVVRYVFERTSQVYFLANQLEMLEITNLEITPASSAAGIQSPGPALPPPVSTSPAASFRALVDRWEQLHSRFQGAVHPGNQAAEEKIQVVAFSDPSDVLTWRVPRIGDVDVVNLYVRNARHWLWIFESPTSAHGNYAENKDVLRVMFADAKHHGAGH